MSGRPARTHPALASMVHGMTADALLPQRHASSVGVSVRVCACVCVRLQSKHVRQTTRSSHCTPPPELSPSSVCRTRPCRSTRCSAR